jgi:glycosyltransferase involved in cell wall biosynthesis
MSLKKVHRLEKLKILMVGPLPPPVVGTTVSFRQLVGAMEASEDVKMIIIDTSRKAADFTLLDTVIVAIRSICRLVYNLRKVDVVTFHASVNAALFFGLFIHILSRMCNKPWVLRVFGGNIDQRYEDLTEWMQTIMRKTVFSANICLFQTQHLTNFFKKICRHRAIWFANNRPMDEDLISMSTSGQCRKFIYVGNVKYSKGIKEVIEAGEQLGETATIDIFGPFQEGMTESDFNGLKIVKYCGLLPPDKVISTLGKYDVLLIPTYYKGEGYPGVILESYAAGIPVIASRWRAIPEIVDESSGMLVEPKNVDALLSAMKQLMANAELYKSLRHGVLKKRKLFSAEKWTNEFIRYCRMLAEK